ncbi:MAG: DNA adenine methylase, partial [Gammaproteobacteria bacterium]|nr:DNA adenine methylase [Gammaproteobacteria bacterium]
FHLYTILKNEGAAFIEKCRHYFSAKYNNEEQYYKIRKQFNETNDHYKRAILFVYLNRHSYLLTT